MVFEVADARALVARLADAGVKMGALGPTTVRAVTHLDVDAEGAERRGRAAVRGARLLGLSPAKPTRRRRIASATRSALSGGRSFACRRRCFSLGPTRSSTSAARSGGAAR